MIYVHNLGQHQSHESVISFHLIVTRASPHNHIIPNSFSSHLHFPSSHFNHIFTTCFIIFSSLSSHHIFFQLLRVTLAMINHSWTYLIGIFHYNTLSCLNDLDTWTEIWRTMSVGLLYVRPLIDLKKAHSMCLSANLIRLFWVFKLCGIFIVMIHRNFMFCRRMNLIGIKW